MGEEKDRSGAPLRQAGDEASSDPAAPLAPTLLEVGDGQAPQLPPEEPARAPAPEPAPEGGPWPAPGHIPEPRERAWDAEPADPFDGIDRSSPFEGRPEGEVPRPDELDGVDEEPPGPGQPLRAPPSGPADGGSGRDQG